MPPARNPSLARQPKPNKPLQLPLDAMTHENKSTLLTLVMKNAYTLLWHSIATRTIIVISKNTAFSKAKLTCVARAARCAHAQFQGHRLIGERCNYKRTKSFLLGVIIVY